MDQKPREVTQYRGLSGLVLFAMWVVLFASMAFVFSNTLDRHHNPVRYPGQLGDSGNASDTRDTSDRITSPQFADDSTNAHQVFPMLGEDNPLKPRPSAEN